MQLEDIAVSLFVVTQNRAGRMRRPLGVRQPRWIKFLQVRLLWPALSRTGPARQRRRRHACQPAAQAETALWWLQHCMAACW